VYGRACTRRLGDAGAGGARLGVDEAGACLGGGRPQSNLKM
jgi:hypothetical protein